MLTEEKIISLYREHGKELYVYLYRFIGNSEQAEDILHDVFVNLITYSRKAEVREETVKAFLYRSAHNLAINYIKKNKNIKMIMLDENIPLKESSDANDSVELKELREAVKRVLSELDPVTRSVFIMKKELNLKIYEIADKTGLSERTVKRKLHLVSRMLSEEAKKSGLSPLTLFLLSLFAFSIVQKM